MTAPRLREQRRPPSPPDRLPPHRGSGPSPYTLAASAAGRPAGFGRLAAVLLLAAGAVLWVSPALAQPAAPTGFEVEPGGSIKAKLAWNEPASGSGIVRHEVRFRASAAAFPDTWTRIPSSRPGQDNAAGYLLDGLTAETAYDFELRAVSGDGPGAAASASATTLVPFTARFSPLKTWYEGTSFTMTIVFTAPIDQEVVRAGVLVQGGSSGGVRAGDDAATWHVTASRIRNRARRHVLPA